MENLASLLVYFLIVVSLIWARFNFFEAKSNSSRYVLLVNDPMVVVQIIVTFLYLYSRSLSPGETCISLLGYSFSLLLFWWSLVTVKILSFASDDLNGEIIMNGPYSVVRHPLYLSYILVWFTSTIVFKSALLWGSFLILVGVYVFSAWKEEALIMTGLKSVEYRDYRKRVGMFFPTKYKKSTKRFS